MALTAIAIATVLRDSHILRFRLPENRRLVPQTVFRKGVIPAAFQFGVELGTGVRTYVTSTAPYLLSVAVLLFADLPIAMIAGLGFGLGRASTPIARYWSPDGDIWDALLERRLTGLVRICSVGAGTSALLLAIQ